MRFPSELSVFFIETTGKLQLTPLVVMDDLEKEKLANLDLEVPVYLRYVDDILIVAPSTQVDRILQIFNANETVPKKSIG